MAERRASARSHRLLGSLRARLLLAFVLVSLVAVGLVAVLANRATTQQFELYVDRGRQARAERLAAYFAAYFVSQGSWDGVEALAGTLAETGSMIGRGMRMGPGRRPPGPGSGPMMASPSADRLLLADDRGRVVADSDGQLSGTTLSAPQLAAGTRIIAEGAPVGVLLLTSMGPVRDPLQAEFLSQVNSTLLWAGLGAGLVAVLLSILMARQLTAPLRELTQAAERVSEGQLDQRVDARGADEIVDLGQSFNRMAAALAEQETLRRNLMADVAHELRTPLTVIRGDLEALLDGIYEATPETFASLRDETLVLSRLIDDLRALSLAESGQLPLRKETVSLSQALSRAAATFAPLAEARGIELRWVPPADALELTADAQRLQQIVANLLSNAMHYTPAGGRITLSAEGRDAEVEVTVADTGPGIAPQDLPRVFDRYWQSDLARPGEGSGLGLTIVRGLVQAHGGRVWAKSQAGQGAMFHFTLPRNSESSS